MANLHGFPMPNATVLDRSPVVIVVFTMHGCSHCADFLPKWKRIAQPYVNHVPIMMVDANDRRFQDLANRLNVEGVPATFLLRKPAGMIKIEGDASPDKLQWLLDVASREMQYPNSQF